MNARRRVANATALSVARREIGVGGGGGVGSEMDDASAAQGCGHVEETTVGQRAAHQPPTRGRQPAAAVWDRDLALLHFQDTTLVIRAGGMTSNTRRCGRDGGRGINIGVGSTVRSWRCVCRYGIRCGDRYVLEEAMPFVLHGFTRAFEGKLAQALQHVSLVHVESGHGFQQPPNRSGGRRHAAV